MKKKVFVFLVLALIVASAAFAQRVGDTVQVTQYPGESWTVQSVNGNDITLRKVVQAGLTGTWNRRGSNQGMVGPASITFSGTGATVAVVDMQGNANDYRRAYVQAVEKGLIKRGDAILRNIRSTGTNTWSCQFLVPVYTDGGSRLNVTGTEWKNGTITYAVVVRYEEVFIEGLGTYRKE